MQFILRYKLAVIGLISGAIVGYTYYYFVGCASGACPITSKPVNSALYGAMMGGLFFSLFKKKEKSVKNINREK
ncbi:MAG: DUF6132 family protein [Chitinophagales bacterium]